jgi:ribosome-associated translation inhibitor RaiA
MRYLILFIFFTKLLFAGVWSTTSMSIATGTLSALVGANMATLVAQVVDIKSDFDSKAAVAVEEKTDFLSAIESVEAKIMVEMRRVVDNQEKINILYSKQ